MLLPEEFAAASSTYVLRPVLDRWAGRFPQNQTVQRRIVETTISIASGNPDLLDGESVDKALYLVLRDVALQEMEITSATSADDAVKGRCGTMTRYTFHLRNGETHEISGAGMGCETLDQARTEALTAAREFITEKVLNGEVLKVNGVEIRTGTGEPVLFIPIETIVRPG